MSDLDQIDSGTAIPGEAAPDPQPQTAYSETSDDGDITERAKSQGWVPKEEFRGDPDKWRPADEFVKRGEEIVPILRERTRTLASKLEEAERKIAREAAESAERFAKLERMTETALSKQRSQIVNSYEAAMRSAVETGDVARFDQLRRDQYTAVEAHDKQIETAVRPAPPVSPQQAPEYQQAVSQWEQRNTWFKTDGEMAAVAEAYSQRLARETPSITLADNLKKTEEYVRKRYADKFQASAGSASVEGGGRMASSAGPRSKGVNELPADAKAQGMKFVQQKLFKDLNEYARDYFAQ